MELRLGEPQRASQFNGLQYVARIYLHQKGLKIGHFRQILKSVLGAGGREFESRRPDQYFQDDAASFQRPEKSTVDEIVDGEILRLLFGARAPGHLTSNQ